MAWRRDLTDAHREYRKAKLHAAPYMFAVSVALMVVFAVVALLIGEVDLALWLGGLTLVMSVIFAIAVKTGARNRQRLLDGEPDPFQRFT